MRFHLRCAVGAVLRGRVYQLSCSTSLTPLFGMVYVRRRVWLLCASAAAASLLMLRPFQAAEEPAASSLPDVEALRNPCSSKMTRRAPEAFRACFGTSHGPFEAHCVRRRAPVWVDRVYNLLVNGFYDDQRGRMSSVPRSHEHSSGLHVGRWQPLGSGPLSPRQLLPHFTQPILAPKPSRAASALYTARYPPKVGHLRGRPSHGGCQLRPRYFPRVLNGSGLSVVQFGTSGNRTASNAAPALSLIPAPPPRTPHPTYS